MSLNRIYVGYPLDINIGNGKTSSAVGAIIDLWAESLLNEKEKTIFSNIKLIDIEYQEITPKNLMNVLDTKDAIVLFDELHAIVHKNHKIHEGCTKHSVKGLCYYLSEFFRQVRKRDIDTYTTCQTLSDAPFQYRQLMNVQVYCELGYVNDGVWKKCRPLDYPGQKCPEWHKHIIKQYITPNSQPWKKYYFNPEPIYHNYDSFEIVKGWIPQD